VFYSLIAAEHGPGPALDDIEQEARQMTPVTRIEELAHV
jgi:hypothetical protein